MILVSFAFYKQVRHKSNLDGNIRSHSTRFAGNTAISLSSSKSVMNNLEIVPHGIP
jgi:hypothetical protein